MTRRAGAAPSRTIAAVLGGLLLLLSLGAWALASPAGSTPDEDYHLVSAWCGQGLRDGLCEAGPDESVREVPRALVKSACFGFDSEESARCQAEESGPPGATIVSDRGNFEGDYPPVNYFVSSLFAGPDLERSVVTMRVVHATLLTLVVAAIAVASPAGLRRGLLGGLVVTVVPMGMSLVPSVNPSGWAIVSSGALAVSVLGYLTVPRGPRRLVLGALAAVALLLGAGARADGALYGVVAVGVAVILTWHSGREHLRRLVYPGVLAVVAAISFLSAGQSDAVSATPPGALTWDLLGELAVTVPDLWLGNFGTWGLGWVDTAMPPLVTAASWAVFGAALLAGLAGADRRRGLALAAVASGALLVPTYIQYLSSFPVGFGVHPRYILPLLTLLAVTALVRLDGAAFRVTSGQRWVVVVLLSLANAAALHATIRRYVTGDDVSAADLDAAREWWWSFGPQPQTVWVLGALAFASGLALLSPALTTPAPAAVRPARSGSTDDRPAPGSGAGGHLPEQRDQPEVPAAGGGRPRPDAVTRAGRPTSPVRTRPPSVPPRTPTEP
ncbi:DUF2142 domain-containing protein [Cellulomonas aerilata]|uniref:DUF2142 domain-containing protein n=1 Tax=Cellulomonas aerilata TaxID=515326 RepID=A0A512DDA8_9CELL|nr:DUF2142 domain-containing protein [Cellulomonas aerilata]GEO34455.1 hypothetical protein CAE01nite_21800 [Cellulomonas aerilata]